jgi:hypothetical protein
MRKRLRSMPSALPGAVAANAATLRRRRRASVICATVPSGLPEKV